MQGCGYAGLRYAVRRRKGIGHMALFSHPMPVGIRVLVLWFLSHPMPLRIWGLRIVEAQVL